MPGLIGLDIAAVRQLGTSLKGQADALASIATAVDGIVDQLAHSWHGPDADEFRGWWQSQHRPALEAAGASLAGLGQSAHNNASAQDGVSSTAAVGAAAGATAAVAQRAESWKHTSSSGVGGEGVETTATRLVQMSDGSWRVEVRTSSSFRLAFDDVYGVASLATRGALDRVLDVGGGVDVAGTGFDLELAFTDEAAARRFLDDIKKHANGPVDSLELREVMAAIDREHDRGTAMDVISSGRHWESASADLSLSVGPLEVGGGGGASSVSAGLEGGLRYDEVTTVVATGSVEASALAVEAGFEGAAQESIKVLRDGDGRVVGLEVTSTVSPTTSSGISSSALLDKLGVPGTGWDRSTSSSFVVDQTTVYDISDSVRTQLGCSDMSGPLSADQIRQMREVVAAQSSATRTTEVIAATADDSSGGVLMAYEIDKSEGVERVVSRTVQRLSPP